MKNMLFQNLTVSSILFFLMCLAPVYATQIDQCYNKEINAAGWESLNSSGDTYNSTPSMPPADGVLKVTHNAGYVCVEELPSNEEATIDFYQDGELAGSTTGIFNNCAATNSEEASFLLQMADLSPGTYLARLNFYSGKTAEKIIILADPVCGGIGGWTTMVNKLTHCISTTQHIVHQGDREILTARFSIDEPAPLMKCEVQYDQGERVEFMYFQTYENVQPDVAVSFDYIIPKNMPVGSYKINFRCISNDRPEFYKVYHQSERAGVEIHSWMP